MKGTNRSALFACSQLSQKKKKKEREGNLLLESLKSHLAASLKSLEVNHKAKLFTPIAHMFACTGLVKRVIQHKLSENSLSHLKHSEITDDQFLFGCHVFASADITDTWKPLL